MNLKITEVEIIDLRSKRSKIPDQDHFGRRKHVFLGGGGGPDPEGGGGGAVRVLQVLHASPLRGTLHRTAALQGELGSFGLFQVGVIYNRTLRHTG